MGNPSWAGWHQRPFSVVQWVLENRSCPRVYIADGTGRAGKPEEIAAPVLLLASRGGMYMNDTCVNIDGGRWLVSDIDPAQRHTANAYTGHEGDFRRSTLAGG